MQEPYKIVANFKKCNITILQEKENYIAAILLPFRLMKGRVMLFWPGIILAIFSHLIVFTGPDYRTGTRGPCPGHGISKGAWKLSIMLRKFPWNSVFMKSSAFELYIFLNKYALFNMYICVYNYINYKWNIYTIYRP